MKTLMLACMALAITASNAPCAQTTDDALGILNTDLTTTWTWTYIKADEGKADAAQQFVEANWFAMDRIAVQRGLFRDYRLILNGGEHADWDFIVAVEYFGNESYVDIASHFEEIRRAHQTESIEGFDPGTQMSVVRSEQGVDANKFRALPPCNPAAFEVVRPFLGVWYERDAQADDSPPFGLLEFSIDPTACSLSKRFYLTSGDGGYVSTGFLDAPSGRWKEHFSLGVEFEWVVNSEGTFMVNRSTDPASEVRGRNQWLMTDRDHGQIIEQYSEDGGQSWEVRSITALERR